MFGVGYRLSVALMLFALHSPVTRGFTVALSVNYVCQKLDHDVGTSAFNDGHLEIAKNVYKKSAKYQVRASQFP